MAARTVSTAAATGWPSAKCASTSLAPSPSSEQRLAELSQDLAQTCPLASCYQSWLCQHRHELPIGRHRSLKKTRRERREAVQAWLRQSCSGSAS